MIECVNVFIADLLMPLAFDTVLDCLNQMLIRALLAVRRGAVKVEKLLLKLGNLRFEFCVEQ